MTTPASTETSTTLCSTCQHERGVHDGFMGVCDMHCSCPGFEGRDDRAVPIDTARIAYAEAAALLSDHGTYDIVYADSCTILCGIAVEQPDFTVYLADGVDSRKQGLGMGWTVTIVGNAEDSPQWVTTNHTMRECVEIALHALAEPAYTWAVDNAVASLRDINENGPTP
jgi:hypothetical protein